MRKSIWALLGLGVIPQALAADTLSTQGFNLCMANSEITINNLNVAYSRSTNNVAFDVAGTNSKEQDVIATLTVTAYGNQVYSRTFDPCGSSIHVSRLCPGTPVHISQCKSQTDQIPQSRQEHSLPKAPLTSPRNMRIKSLPLLSTSPICKERPN